MSKDEPEFYTEGATWVRCDPPPCGVCSKPSTWVLIAEPVCDECLPDVAMNHIRAAYRVLPDGQASLDRILALAATQRMLREREDFASIEREITGRISTDVQD